MGYAVRLMLLGGLLGWWTESNQESPAGPARPPSIPATVALAEPQSGTRTSPSVTAVSASHPVLHTNHFRSAPPRPPNAQSLHPVVHFNGQSFGFRPAADRELAALQAALSPGQSAVVLLGLLDRPRAGLRHRYTASGVDLLSYVADHGWIARVHGRQPPSGLHGVSFVRLLDAAVRIHASLRDVPQPGDDVPVYVHAVRDRPAARLLPTLAAAGFDRLTVQTVGADTYLAGTVPGAQLAAFLAVVGGHEDVQFIERGGRARLLNNNAMRITQAGDFLGDTPFFNHGLYGSNQIIAVCDTGLDVDACAFRNAAGALPPTNRLDGTNVNLALRKVIAANFLYDGDDPAHPLHWDNHGHGTSVAGCAAGADIYAPYDTLADNGMAPAAKLIIQDAGFAGGDACADLIGLGCPVTNFYPALLQAVAQGATIHNNSWGDQEDSAQQNTYTQTCRELDLVTWANKQFLVVCAAGNNAWSDTVGSPSVAKNALSVAASLSGSGQERMASFSSRGWASDGRFKPDLTAPGHNLRTAGSDADITTGNCWLTSRSGTSFASPIVAGLAALVRDYFAQGFYSTGTPVSAHQRPAVSAALVKAVLINAALHVSNAVAFPPARDQGWGRVNLAAALPLTNGPQALLAVDAPLPFRDIPAFPYRAYVRLRSANVPFKTTLVWTDFPATAGADKHLVNDLDLRARTPQGTFKGNGLSAGGSEAGGDYDRLNNVEQIRFQPTTTGLVELTVWAHQIVEGPQDFALVATGDFEEIPASRDDDGDGLPDYWELWHWGNLAPSADGDPDADLASNAAECAAGTDPNDSHSQARLTLATVSNRVVTVALTVCEGRQYTLEHTERLGADAAWLPVDESLLVGEPVLEQPHGFAHHLPTHGPVPAAQFYRVRIAGPESAGVVGVEN